MIVAAGAKFPVPLATVARQRRRLLVGYGAAAREAGSHHSRLSEVIFRRDETVLKQSHPISVG
jgi:hypothetical protein